MRVPDRPSALNLPYPSWWKHEQVALQKIVDSRAKVNLIVAPTGSGKSALGIGLIRMLKAQTSYILTKTKQLQDQYFDTFPGLHVCMGRSNYHCVVPQQEHKTVDKGLCQSGWPCILKSGCPYYIELKRAKMAPEVVFNYAMWMASSQFVGAFRECDVMVADEGHELEKEVVKFSKIRLVKGTFAHWGLQIPIFIDVSTYAEWAADILPGIFNSRRHLEEQLFRTRVDSEEMDDLVRDVQQLVAIQHTLRRVQRAPEEGRWFIQELKNGGVDMVPVWASHHASVIFEAAQRKAIVMSATLLPTDKTAHRLGLTDDYEFIEVPSTFDGSRSPIVFCPVASLNKKNLERKLPELLAATDRILNDHLPEERGLIHTSNYFIRDYIMENSRFKKLMVTHDSRSRGKVIKAFSSKEGPPVLVSPSMGTGFSGDYDKARFQLMLKYPYPDLGDPLIRLRQDEDPESYDYDANSAFVQMAGRLMRAPDDRGITYVLDGQLERMAKLRPKHFPDWVKERIC